MEDFEKKCCEQLSKLGISFKIKDYKIVCEYGNYKIGSISLVPGKLSDIIRGFNVTYVANYSEEDYDNLIIGTFGNDFRILDNKKEIKKFFNDLKVVIKSFEKASLKYKEFKEYVKLDKMKEDFS